MPKKSRIGCELDPETKKRKRKRVSFNPEDKTYDPPHYEPINYKTDLGAAEASVCRHINEDALLNSLTENLTNYSCLFMPSDIKTIMQYCLKKIAENDLLIGLFMENPLIYCRFIIKLVRQSISVLKVHHLALALQMKNCSDPESSDLDISPR